MDEEPVELPVTDTLDLHMFEPRDIPALVEEHLALCIQRGFRYVRIIHGKGTGVQKQIVRSILQNSALVESYQDGPDWGSTAVVLKL